MVLSSSGFIVRSLGPTRPPIHLALVQWANYCYLEVILRGWAQFHGTHKYSQRISAQLVFTIRNLASDGWISKDSGDAGLDSSDRVHVNGGDVAVAVAVAVSRHSEHNYRRPRKEDTRTS
ncbi:hypothetical protein J7T55_015325 [Diaporthe amygdali]|uniref:uncharacterized protein n=1 Tax=Phomopsis amygdali TaxID=1214568 RepID=UPI0022FE3910|nr:uncharacterized protein J7T55_015325 [Diaporthe amygdali]KAJ0120596.1 hypothetical protein J7T55_015325 [Diaporthe amygdali]